MMKAKSAKSLERSSYYCSASPILGNRGSLTTDALPELVRAGPTWVGARPSYDRAVHCPLLAGGDAAFGGFDPMPDAGDFVFGSLMRQARSIGGFCCASKSR